MRRTHGAAGADFTILNQLGWPVRRAGPGQPALDVGGLPAGLYFLQHATSGQRAKFLKTD